jgi:hypothetical protein
MYISPLPYVKGDALDRKRIGTEAKRAIDKAWVMSYFVIEKFP